MGHRANLVLVDENGYQLFSCHWCANQIPIDIFWGAQYAVPYILSQQAVPHNAWMDHLWAEGGVLIDVVRHHLLVYGGEDISCELPLRRLYLDLMCETWPEWTITWAHDGIADLGAYVGLSRAQFVLESDRERSELNESRLITDDSDYGPTLIFSIIFETSQLMIMGLDELHITDLLRIGPDLVGLARQGQFSEKLMFDREKEFPWGGVHIDVPSKRIEFWSVDDPGIMEILPPLWPGWEFLWLKDNFEAHLVKLENRVILPVVDTEEVIIRLRRILIPTNDFDPLKMMRDLIQRHKSEGADVQVNPNALTFAPQEINTVTREQIFDAAVTQWREKSANTP